MTDASDIDVAVVVLTPEEVRPTRKRCALLSRDLQWPIDLLVFDLAEFTKKSQMGGVAMIIADKLRNSLNLHPQEGTKKVIWS